MKFKIGDKVKLIRPNHGDEYIGHISIIDETEEEYLFYSKEMEEAAEGHANAYESEEYGSWWVRFDMKDYILKKVTNSPILNIKVVLR